MPIYEFRCEDCKKKYDSFFKSMNCEGQIESLVCPKCGSNKKTRLVSSFEFSFSDPVGTDRYENSHQYRWESKQPKIREERKAAMEAAGGVNPYSNIDDISSGDNFGEVR